jgi:succinylarginine dihydrolase
MHPKLHHVVQSLYIAVSEAEAASAADHLVSQTAASVLESVVAAAAAAAAAVVAGTETLTIQTLISRFHRDVEESCTLLGH